ncbi:MAG: hypothetical protein WCV85_00985 [Patescibacteria group bacterium]|jgi:hypothetical protein
MHTENPGFLKEKYSNFHTSEEVERAAVRTEGRTGEKVPQDPAAKIQNYLGRLERLAMDSEKTQGKKMVAGKSRPRALSLLRDMVMEKYVRANKDKLAEGAARVEERAARNLGMDVRYNEEALEQRGEIAVEDLEKSLDNWLLYLSDANEPYPTWFRYYAFRNVLEMGDFDKDKGEFTKRSPGTTRLFPDVDHGALAHVQQMIEAAKDPAMLARLQDAQRAAANNNLPAGELLTKEKVAAFAKLSFAKQYAEGIRQAGEITPEMKEETQGKWVTYQKGTDPTALWASLQNKGTAWCTKGYATAAKQLETGDFHVHYTLDSQGKPTIPRIAIRMDGDQIGEVRGVADNQQNLEGNMITIAEEKMAGLPGAEGYKKKSADMKALTEIEQAVKANKQLTSTQLRFLYEVDSPIEQFGFKRDPRINELLATRNPEEDIHLYGYDIAHPDTQALKFIYDIGDKRVPRSFLPTIEILRRSRNIEADLPVVFECIPDQIARDAEHITEDTKAYVGKLVPGIFQMLPEGIEHIYTAFPEGRIRQDPVNIGGTTKADLQRQLEEQGIGKTSFADYMLDSRDFTTGTETETANLVRLTVEMLGFPKGATTKEIYERAEELGLELCPAEVGPQYRLKNTNQPMNESIVIGMKQITSWNGNPHVFNLERDENGLWLYENYAKSNKEWNPKSEFAFRLRKKKKEAVDQSEVEK